MNFICESLSLHRSSNLHPTQLMTYLKNTFPLSPIQAAYISCRNIITILKIVRDHCVVSLQSVKALDSCMLQWGWYPQKKY